MPDHVLAQGPARHLSSLVINSSEVGFVNAYIIMPMHVNSDLVSETKLKIARLFVSECGKNGKVGFISLS